MDFASPAWLLAVDRNSGLTNQFLDPHQIQRQAEPEGLGSSLVWPHRHSKSEEIWIMGCSKYRLFLQTIPSEAGTAKAASTALGSLVFISSFWCLISETPRSKVVAGRMLIVPPRQTLSHIGHMNEMEKRIDHHNIFALSDQTGECYLASCQCDLNMLFLFSLWSIACAPNIWRSHHQKLLISLC